MEFNGKLRAASGALCAATLVYYAYEVCIQLENWDSLEEIRRATECGEAYVVEA